MSKIVKDTENRLHSLVTEALGKAIADGVLPAEPIPGFKVEVPADRSNGDYSVNAAFACARAFRTAPKKIADAVSKYIDLGDSYFESCSVAGPGFINFTLGDRYYADILLDIKKCGEKYGSSDFGKNKKVNVEFVSANPTGPMHMGNARGGALGDCLASVLSMAGYDVSREFYINDAGNQIDKFALSLDIRYQQLFSGDKAPSLPEDSYHGADIKERAEEFAKQYGDSYMEKSEKERRKALVDFALPKNIQNMKDNLAKYRIKYDTWFHESVLHNGAVDDVIKILTDNGMTYEKDGALWYKNIEMQTKLLKKAGKTKEQIDRLELKDDVLIRQNGNPTYFAADIAYHRNKLVDRGFDKAIDVWGADHHGHVARMKGAMDAIGLNGNDLDVVLMQMVNLMRDGQPVRMSKRTGNAITLTDLLEEVPIDSARFLFNMHDAGSGIDFDLDQAVKTDNDNPVYYVQYAHARICSILKKMESEGVSFAGAEQVDATLLTEPSEMDLIRMLAAFPQEIVMAAEKYDPSRINRFVIDLASAFHRFYGNCRIQGADPALQQARLALCIGVKNAIFNVLTMFKINVPEKM